MHMLVFIIGPAGSGKSTFTASFRDWLHSQEAPVSTVNLDPAVENLEYVPDVDIREHVFIRDVLEEYGLGPNGAIIAAVDMSIEHLPSIDEGIDSTPEGYVLLDTPGQMELFMFRQSGGIIVSSLCKSNRKCATAFLLDATLSTDPYNFVSQIFLAASAFYRLRLPLVILLNKIDVLSEAERERISAWISSPEILENEIARFPRDYDVQFSRSVVRLVLDFLDLVPIVMVSAKRSQNLDAVYFYLQQIYMGGEDFERTTKD